MCFCIKNYIGTQGEVLSTVIYFKSPEVYITDCSKAVVLVLFLFCISFCFPTRRFKLSLGLWSHVVIVSFLFSTSL